MKTPELSVLAARKEIISFANRMQRMFEMVTEMLGEKDNGKFNKLYDRIEKYEGISDNMELEIGKYLEQVSDAHLSDDTKAKIRGMLREISELESIGDSCYHLARTLKRKNDGKDDFTEDQYNHMEQMMQLTDQALLQMNKAVSGRRDEQDFNRSRTMENEINNYRSQLRKQNVLDVDNHLYSYENGTLYMDVINECEKLGDYIINVLEARLNIR